MDIRVTGRHIELPDDLLEYVHSKAGKLPRFYDRIHEVEVVFDQQAEQFSAEMIVRIGHKHTLIASESGPDTYALVDLIVDKMERQLNKHKEKQRNHKHDGRPDQSAATEDEE